MRNSYFYFYGKTFFVKLNENDPKIPMTLGGQII